MSSGISFDLPSEYTLNGIDGYFYSTFATETETRTDSGVDLGPKNVSFGEPSHDSVKHIIPTCFGTAERGPS